MAHARVRPILLLLVVVGLAAAGCGDDDGTAPGAAGGDAPTDEIPWGTDLVSTLVSRDGGDGLVPGTRIRLSFHDDQRVTASAGCNTISVDDAEVTDGRLRATAGAMTEMGCDAALHAQDEWLSGFLAADPSWSWDGTTLVLATADAEVTLVDEEVAEPDRALEGTVWVLDGLIDGTGPDSGVSSVPDGVEATLEIADGQLGVGGPCNGMAGAVTVDGDRLVTGEVASTAMGCDPALEAVEVRIGAVLADATWEIDGDRLTLTGTDGRGLTFQAAPDGDAAPG